MNATDRAKRSDSLHYDNIPRRALCDRIANLESDLEDTKTENAKLREYVTKIEQDNLRLDSDNCDLRNDMRDMQRFIDENRKLRKLVADMWDFYCVMPDEPLAFKEEIDFSVEVWKRMRELGVDG